MAYFSTDDNYRLYYDEYGDKNSQPMIFLYDLGGKRSFFSRQAEFFKGQYHVFVVDYRGHGAAEKAFRQLNLERLAKDLHCMVELNDLKDMILVGNGLGAGIILSYIRAYGEENISTLVLMDERLKYICGDTWKYGFLQDELAAVNYAKAMTYDWEKFAPGPLKEMLGEHYEVSETDQKFITDSYLDNRNSIMIALTLGYITQDYRDVAKGLTKPVLCTYGNNESQEKRDAVAEAARLFKNAKLAGFMGGSLHYYLDAAHFNEAVKGFLAEAR